MSIVTRLTSFFLATLAVILLGFSLGIYALARNYLYGQLDAHLITALDTLETAVDVEDDGLDWDSSERTAAVGTEPATDQVRWTVSDEQGRTIDHSTNLAKVDFPASWEPIAWPHSSTDGTAFGMAPGWRIAARRLQLEELLRRDRAKAKHSEPDDNEGHRVLILRAGIPPGPVEGNLRQLAWAITLLPIGLWLGCAIVGRRICRTALKPLSQMALAARRMTPGNPDERLPAPPTGDELADLGDAFNGLLGRLHEALDRQQRFAGDASHQLRTPITGLLSLVEVVRRRKREPGEYEETLDRIYAETSRMRQIVESLLFLARSEADTMLLECEPIDLAVWLPQQIERWKSHPRGGDLQLELDSGLPAWINAQPLLLGQLLDNLIDNAGKYSPAASPITIRLERGAGTVGFCVQDQGCGIAAADQAHIFEPFFRSAESRRQGTSGEGLGLALAQRIATNFGGTLKVSSEPGHGARFMAQFSGLIRSADASPQRTATA